jgi:hypothetical protein
MEPAIGFKPFSAEGKMFKPGSLCIALAVVILSIPSLGAPQPPDPPSAPKPSQIFDAKKIFISNTSPATSRSFGGPDRPYNAFYANMKGWGQYELVSAPADADLIVEIGYVAEPRLDEMRLAIVDPKTHVVLWAFAEYIQVIARKATAIKNIDTTVATLVTDLKHLVTPPATSSQAPAK